MKISFEKWHFAPEFIPLLHDKNPTKVLYGSRNSTKSDIACFIKLYRCLTLKYFKCLMVRKFKEDVRASIYETIKAVAKRTHLDRFFVFKDHTLEIICTINGNSFIPLGLYEHGGKTGNAKSIKDPTDALLDEADQCSENEYEDMVFSLRGSEDIETILIFNTNVVDESHWLFKRFFPPRETFEKLDGSHSYIKSIRANTTIMHSTYIMNPFVPDIILDSFEDQKKHSKERYNVTGLGLLKTAKQSNMALKDFDRITHVSEKVKFNDEYLVYLTWDFNKIPHHTVGLWQFGGYEKDSNFYNWDLVNEFCLPDHSIKEVCNEVVRYLRKNEYKSKRIVIICDYSGNTKRDHDEMASINKIKHELTRAGFDISDKTIVNPSVVSSLDFFNDILARCVKVCKMNDKYAGATINIRINPICKFHITDFEKTKTGEDGNLLKVTKRETFIEDDVKVNRTYQVRGHAVDNTRYLLTSIFDFEYKEFKARK